MSTIKTQIKYLLERTGLRKKRSLSPWSGDFASWAEAAAQCTGYDQYLILEKVKDAVLKVKRGEAIYERDSVVFDHVEFTPEVLEAFSKISSDQDGILNVIDFGGSLGSSYFQYRQLLPEATKIHWTVVEQPHFVEAGNREIAEHGLDFAPTLEEAVNRNKASVLFLSSVLPYLEKPYDLIRKAIALNFEYIVIDRTAFIEGDREHITMQVVPEYIYKASYPAWFFNERKFVTAFLEKYDCLLAFDSTIDPREILDGKWTSRRGFIFKRKA